MLPTGCSIGLTKEYLRWCQRGCVEAAREIHKWKAAHDNQVELRRQVLDRPDLGDRAASVISLRTQLEAVRKEMQVWKTAHDDMVARYNNLCEFYHSD